MKRWAVRICVFLILIVGGAIVNVAVAWGATILAPATSRGIDDDDAERWIRQWIDFAPNRRDAIMGSERTALGYRGIVVHWAPADKDSTLLWVNDAGWPCMSTRCASALGDVSFRTGIQIPKQLRFYDDQIQTRALPTRPIWPGFAINTVLYAFVLWMLFAFPFALRRRRRIQRGLCPKCAYDLRGSTHQSRTCPECGAAVVAKPQRGDPTAAQGNALGHDHATPLKP